MLVHCVQCNICLHYSNYPTGNIITTKCFYIVVLKKYIFQIILHIVYLIYDTPTTYTIRFQNIVFFRSLVIEIYDYMYSIKYFLLNFCNAVILAKNFFRFYFILLTRIISIICAAPLPYVGSKYKFRLFCTLNLKYV